MAPLTSESWVAAVLCSPVTTTKGMLAHINEAVPSVLAWFDGLLPAE